MIHLKKISTEIMNIENPSEKAQHDKLVALVEENMRELQKKYHEARMDGDKELYERQIRIVDAQIDGLVYEFVRADGGGSEGGETEGVRGVKIKIIG